jgi:DNA helicase-2/ATP-dependent DNA helicase PcrA
MAKERLNLPIDFLSSEANKVLEIIENNNNFLLSGGAGSGKTYSLVEILKITTKFYPLVNVACITYTNAAVNEIKSRVDQKNLYVSTIHEFLWANIKQFQSELKETTVDLIKDEEQTRFALLEEQIVDYHFFDNIEKGIQYKEYVKLSDGIIFHLFSLMNTKTQTKLLLKFY